MGKRENQTITKAARLLLLWRLREDAVLVGQTLQAVGDILHVNRSTVLRDLRLLDQVQAEYERLLAAQPWTRRELTALEFAQAIGASPETVRCMLRDGLIEAYKRRERWCIPVSELDRWTRD